MEEFPREQDELEPQLETSPPRRSRLRAVLMGLPYLACVACLALILTLGGPLLERPRGGPLPVTGEDGQQRTPTLTLPPVLEAHPFGTDTTYREAAEIHLYLCVDAFQDFYIIEQMAAFRPDLIESEEWQGDADRAASEFHRDCAPLGQLPDAPGDFAEVDHYLRLAASEIAPAVDSFRVVLEDGQPDGLLVTASHLERFLEYTQKAKDALRVLEKRKNI